jgi:Fis family transcriptional regulator
VSRKLIDACIRTSLDNYFRDLRGADPQGLHELIIDAVEKPLFEAVLARAEGNQSKAADWLGINRNTLRRKLLQHKIVP